MNNVTLRSTIAIVSLAASSMSLSLLPSTANAADAQQFMNGGEYCFLIGEAIPGGWLTKIKMVVSHETGGIAHIDALEKGAQAVNPPRFYAAPLTGSATIASQLTDKKELQISLNGSNFGADETPGVTGVWISNQAITLKRSNLTGHDTGYKTFTPVQTGQPGESNKSAIDENVTPISCREF